MEIIDNIPSVVYHATFLPLLPEIKQYGLVPGGRSHAGFKSWNVIKGVYLGDDPEYVGSLIEDAPDVPEDWLDKIYIISINSSKLNKKYLNRDPQMKLSPEEQSDPNMPKAYIYTSIIPISYFTGIKKGSYHW